MDVAGSPVEVDGRDNRMDRPAAIEMRVSVVESGLFPAVDCRHTNTGAPHCAERAARRWQD
jgi:hypothetical protein